MWYINDKEGKELPKRSSEDMAARKAGRLLGISSKHDDRVQNENFVAQGKYTMELSDTREKVEKVLHEMLASSRSTSNVKQAVLSRLGCLATFLGSK